MHKSSVSDNHPWKLAANAAARLKAARHEARRHRNSRLKQKVKVLSASLVSLALAGCVTVNQPAPSVPEEPTPPCGHTDHGNAGVIGGVASWFQHTPCLVVNNTPTLLNVVQDGKVLAKNVRMGESVSIRPRWSDERAAVVVTSLTEDGRYVGSATRTFLSPGEIWQVDDVVPVGSR